MALLMIFVLYGKIDSNTKYFIYANLLPIVLILLVDNKVIKYDNKYVNYVGKISFDLYLWEGFLLTVKSQLFGTLSNTLLIDFALFFVCILVSQLYNKLFVTPVITYFQKIKLKHSKD